jgi:hypothetical protein
MSAGDPVPGDVPAIVASLREDPILVSQVMGNGATADVDAALHAKLEAAHVPVYVVLTATPAGYGANADEEIASLVHDQLGSDGVYYVHTTQGGGALQVYGDVDPSVTNDDTLYSLALYQGQDQVDPPHDEDSAWSSTPAASAGIVLDIAAHRTLPENGQPALSAGEVATYTHRPWVQTDYVFADDQPQPLSVGLLSVVAVTVAVVFTVLVYRLLAAAPGLAGRRALRAGARSDAIARARSRAEAELASLGRALERPGGDLDRRETARGCHEVATDLLASTDLLDLVGAQVLGVTGLAALRGRPAYRCCYVDPRHSPADGVAEVGRGLSVPVCRSCRTTIEQGGTPEPLREGREPYYEGDSVWARTGYGALSDELWRDVAAARR